MAIITISRHFGAGGHTLGERLCDRFGFQLVDASVIKALAHKSKLSPNWLNAMEQEASSTLLSIISKVVSRGLLYKQPGTPQDLVEQQKYLSFLTQIFTAMANEGGYVIVGRGAQLILKGHPKAFHILLVADYESRVAFLIDNLNITRAEAARMIKVREKERTAIGTRLFDADIDDYGLYHITLNTSLLPYDWAIDTISRLVAQFIDGTIKTDLLMSSGGKNFEGLPTRPVLHI